MADAERIWLEPECCAEPRVGRTWCPVNEWTCCPAGECDAPKPTEYVRADLVEAREAAAAAEARKTMVPISDDARYVFIEGRGLLPIDYSDGTERDAAIAERDAARAEAERLRGIIAEAVRCIGDGCEDEADRFLRAALAGEGRGDD